MYPCLFERRPVTRRIAREQADSQSTGNFNGGSHIQCTAQTLHSGNRPASTGMFRGSMCFPEWAEEATPTLNLRENPQIRRNRPL